MTEQDDTITILIEPAEGGYGAIGPIGSAVLGGTMGEALKAALQRVESASRDRVWVKVREETRVTVQELVALLRIVREAHRLDLSGCDLRRIDLRPEALDALGLKYELRWRLHDRAIRGISLDRLKLQGAYLRGAQLQDAELSDAHLQGANLEEAQLQGAVLRGAQLQGANLGGAQLQSAYLMGARLEGARLRYARLEGAYLGRAELKGVDLRRAQLQGAQLPSAELQGADLRGADLREVDFRGVGSLHRVRWHNARLEKTWMYRHQIDPIQDELDAITGSEEGTYREAMETFLVLKTNFSSLGTYEGAAWAYVKEQQMRKAIYFPTTPGKRWLVKALAEQPPPYWWSCSPRALRYRFRSALLHVRLFLKITPANVKHEVSEHLDRPRWMIRHLFEFLTLYGESPWRPFWWGLGIILAFFLVYMGAGNITPGGWLNALTHSVAAFATIGFNTLEPVGWGARLLTAVESMLGIGLFALLVYTLGNRMSRS